MSASSLERDSDCMQADFPDSVGRAETGWPGCCGRAGRLQGPEGCASARVNQTRRLAGAWPSPAFAQTLHLFPASLHLLVLLLQLERTLSPFPEKPPNVSSASPDATSLLEAFPKPSPSSSPLELHGGLFRPHQACISLCQAIQPFVAVALSLDIDWIIPSKRNQLNSP